MYSNGYIFRFAIIMVVIVAALLSGVSMALKPYQERNATNEKMQTILAAAEVSVDSDDEVDVMYDQYIKKELVLNMSGEVIGLYENGQMVKGNVRAFDVKLKEQLKNIQAYHEGDKAVEVLLPAYIFDDGTKVLTIIPMQGKGLWGPIYGTIALKKDMNTLYGAVFNHKGETPGLGAEIATPSFQSQFKDKMIFDNGEFVSVAVVKGGVKNSAIDPSHGVDAISGGTITSVGVSDMIKNTFELYVPYFTQQH
ncbi:MAG: NADH:ubiquinone reductase (Na(+)-transporting) subunit C [Bacteroidetes bacterium]|nr:MAG: NADH:ubiquinone reductase (Na(+)-transporting) subunit C [Bacteroidota bacterium]